MKKCPSRLKSLHTGGKDHTQNFPGSYRKPPFFLLVVFSSITEFDDVLFEGNIPTLNNVLQGCGCKGF